MNMKFFVNFLIEYQKVLYRYIHPFYIKKKCVQKYFIRYSEIFLYFKSMSFFFDIFFLAAQKGIYTDTRVKIFNIHIIIIDNSII